MTRPRVADALPKVRKIALSADPWAMTPEPGDPWAIPPGWGGGNCPFHGPSFEIGCGWCPPAPCSVYVELAERRERFARSAA